MRRLVSTLAATASILAVAPATALAHHHHHHFGARTHHTRFMRFGDVSNRPSTASSTGNAGTIASFTGGVLTIQLTDGSTVSGTVANDTKIECAAAAQSGEDRGDGDRDQGDQSTSGDDDQASGGSDQSTGDDDQGSGDDDQSSGGSCSSSDLKPGTAIRAAELRISGAGKVWEKVELGS